MTATQPATSQPDTRTSRANNFDAVRLAAALCVAIEHTVTHLNTRFLWYTPGNGRWFPDSVAVFFILSGGMVYASAASCRRRGKPVRVYLRNRYLRIAPAIYTYLAVIVAVLAAAGFITAATATSPHLAAWAVSHILLAPVYHPTELAGFGVGVVNGSLWTIPVEVGYYLLVPVLVWAAARWGARSMLTAAFAVGAASLVGYSALGGQQTSMTVGKLLGVTFLPWLGYFTIGVVATRKWPRLPHRRWWVLAAAVGYGALWLLRRHVAPEIGQVIALGAALPLAYLTFTVAHHGPAVLRKITEKIGDLSFGVYIWHMPVVNLLIWWGIPAGIGGTWLVLAVVAVTVGLAYCSWHTVEKHALRLKRYTSRPVGTP